MQTKWSPTCRNSEEALSLSEFSSAVEGWLLHGDIAGWSARTLSDRRTWISRLRAFLDPNSFAFDVHGLRAFFSSYSKGKPEAGCRSVPSAASVCHVHVTVSAFGNWAVSEGILPSNPMKRIPKPRLNNDNVEPLTEAEINRLLRSASKSRNPLRDSAIMSVLLDSGLRASELSDLRLADVRLSERTALVRCGKGGKTRTVAFGRSSAQALWQYLRQEEHRDAEDYLFTTGTGRPFTKDTLAKLMRRLAADAGVKRANPHKWRHSAAIMLLRNGADLFRLQAQLGHAQLTMTKRYCKVVEEDLRSMQASCSPLDRLKKGPSGR